LLTEAFRWGEWRTVTKTATVSLHGNLYEVDPAFAGSKVELVFDPFDLTDIAVRHHGRPAGKATPFKIGRHVHPKAAADPPPPVTPSGIDYLRLLEDRQTRALGERLRYAQLTESTHPTEPTGPITTAPENQPPAALQPAIDHDGRRYDADLLTLARPDIRGGRRSRRGDRMSLDKLCSFYGFTRTPFRRDLAPGMLHRHTGHAEAVARIRWCINETALGVITGEVGAGKTVALRAALAELDASRYTVIYLPNPAVGARGLYTALVSGLGGVPRFHTASLIAQTMDHLAAEKHERGRDVIVAVDEAHLLSADQLEELRFLTNSEFDSVAPFTGLLLGQPTLRRRIKLGSFAALDQRIALRYTLPGMTDTETRDYLSHHLKLVGRSDQLFSDDAADLIHHTSRGLPRAVNNLALQALVATYAANKTIVDESAARAAVAEVTTE
jgi:type II secretory pathway predicted ATPase ExeA